jgi:hypothetical protein
VEVSAEEVRARNNLAALDAIATIAQREDTMARGAADARRAGIATLLGFDGVLIGLALFATSEVASSEGVLAESDLLGFFAVAAGIAILALVVAALVLLVALWTDGSAVLSREALDELDSYVSKLENGGTADPVNALAGGVRLVVGKEKLLDSQRKKADGQRFVARIGMIATGCGFLSLATAGLIVVAEVLFA